MVSLCVCVYVIHTHCVHGVSKEFSIIVYLSV